MSTYLNIVQIIIATSLIALVIIQARSGGLGGVFGADSAAYRTRRGVERTLFNATVGMAVVFFLLAIITLFISK